MSLELTLYFYDPTAGVDQHGFACNIYLPTEIRLPYGAAALEGPIRQVEDAFHEDWGGVYIQTDDGWKLFKTNPYGRPLTHIRAHALADAMADAGLETEIPSHLYPSERSEHIGWFNGIQAFLRAIPPRTPVVLYWH